MKEVIAQLNIILKNELTAINQYFLHARMLKHQGFSKLAEHEYNESIDEMKHADKLVDRILMLGGMPNLQDLGKLMIGETPAEMLKADLAFERKGKVDLMAAIAVCEQDPTSKNILEAILASEEEHIEFLTIQLKLIETLGLENYLQTQV